MNTSSTTSFIVSTTGNQQTNTSNAGVVTSLVIVSIILGVVLLGVCIYGGMRLDNKVRKFVRNYHKMETDIEELKENVNTKPPSYD